MTTCLDLLASGGADDRIVVYNLKTRKEHCLLTHHNGTVNCLQFTEDHTHLISGGQDGMLAIIRVGNWQLEKVWENAHKGAAILDIALHSSGKLALTLGADSTLRTWNLVKGRQAYVINLNSKSKEPKCLHSIKWAPDGQRFVLVGSTYTDIWSIDSGGVLKSIKHEYKVASCIWQSDEKLIVGYEEGKFAIVNVGSPTDEDDQIIVHDGHSSRVKCMAMHGNKLVTASSTGEIKVWSAKLKQLCVANAGCRFTCMCLVSMENEKVDESLVVEEEIEEINEEEIVAKGKKKKKRVSIIIEDEEEKIKVKKGKKKLIEEDNDDEVIVIKEKDEIKPKKQDKKVKKPQKKKLKQKVC